MRALCLEQLKRWGTRNRKIWGRMLIQKVPHMSGGHLHNLFSETLKTRKTSIDPPHADNQQHSSVNWYLIVDSCIHTKNMTNALVSQKNMPSNTHLRIISYETIREKPSGRNPRSFLSWIDSGWSVFVITRTSTFRSSFQEQENRCTASLMFSS